MNYFSVNNVEQLLTLADEYQVKGVFDLCASCLKNEANTESNAITLFFSLSNTVSQV